MSGYGKRTDIEIAALKKTEMSYNVMLPGSGTPWEDRGAAGFIPAFFKTTLQSLFGFGPLVDHIRRPETSGDANTFVILCGLMWAVGVGIWDAVQYYIAVHNPSFQVDGQQFVIESAIRAAGAIGLTIVIHKLATAIFHSLLTSDAQRQIPKVLVGNVFAYALGPSILAFVPAVAAGVVALASGSGTATLIASAGWSLIALWIAINAIVGARKRLYLRTRESLVNVIIVSVVSVVLLFAVYYAGYLIWHSIHGGQSSVAPIPVSEKPAMN
jgi:hypothetical protein